MSEFNEPQHRPTFGTPDFFRDNNMGLSELNYTQEGSGVNLAYIIQARSYKECFPGKLHEMKVGTQIVSITMSTGEVIRIDGDGNIFRETSARDLRIKERDLGHYVSDYISQVGSTTICLVGKAARLRVFSRNQTRHDYTYAPDGTIENIKVTFQTE